MFELKNYNKPSDPKWKRIGDICLYAIPVYTPILLGMPMPDSMKVWVSSGLNILLATTKIISKFTIDPNYVEPTIIPEPVD